MARSKQTANRVPPVESGMSTLPPIQAQLPLLIAWRP
jgi:hypothetical protein